MVFFFFRWGESVSVSNITDKRMYGFSWNFRDWSDMTWRFHAPQTRREGGLYHRSASSMKRSEFRWNISKAWWGFRNEYLRDDESTLVSYHNVIKWKYLPCYWPFVRGIRRSPGITVMFLAIWYLLSFQTAMISYSWFTDCEEYKNGVSNHVHESI